MLGTTESYMGHTGTITGALWGLLGIITGCLFGSTGSIPGSGRCYRELLSVYWSLLMPYWNLLEPYWNPLEFIGGLLAYWVGSGYWDLL